MFGGGRGWIDGCTTVPTASPRGTETPEPRGSRTHPSRVSETRSRAGDRGSCCSSCLGQIPSDRARSGRGAARGRRIVDRRRAARSSATSRRDPCRRGRHRRRRRPCPSRCRRRFHGRSGTSARSCRWNRRRRLRTRCRSRRCRQVGQLPERLGVRDRRLVLRHLALQPRVFRRRRAFSASSSLPRPRLSKKSVTGEIALSATSCRGEITSWAVERSVDTTPVPC